MPADSWNGPRGQAWVTNRSLLDDIMRPLETALVDAVAGARRVLDVGCGTGSTTVALARRADAAVGVDVSEPMIAAARARATEEGSTATFVRADAQEHDFPAAGFDAVVSRFGVMFFPDPPAAFANLRRATRPGGALRCLVWRRPADNPFLTVTEEAAGPLVPDLPVSPPDAPGRFAFADPDVVRRIVAPSWHDVALEPVDLELSMAERDLVGYFTTFGPLALVRESLDEPTRARAVEAVRAAYEPYVDGDRVRWTAACWMITARA
ncbi:class I SAM-dependent methyltransferase [Cryptosporangium phraense]|uniref:Class I SAM-dependent methyltransferase n=1 Tax=Cryptosporangium phraense TaxID=2593070 RepID=A0A545AIF5_9ACTN|nr:class I SAM-dependent methyltransferase [Cryptosporangium phraense]TQS41107.1 class I SAM-dependent methyltransferase [Cryptosporangium phraense]